MPIGCPCRCSATRLRTAAETYSYIITWGDSQSSSGDVTSVTQGAPVSGSFSGSHPYGDSGVYEVTVTVIRQSVEAAEMTNWSSCAGARKSRLNLLPDMIERPACRIDIDAS